MTIAKVHGREVLDSRGNPTVEVEVTLKDGSFGRAIVPSGASTGQREVLELRDGDPKRYLGKGVLTAVKSVNDTLARLLSGKTVPDIATLDKWMNEADGTPQKGKLGANAILGVSMAYVHAVAQSRKTPLYLVINEMMGVPASEMKLPVPLMNIINGGLHANNGLEFQEFMIVPHGFDRFSEALRAGTEVFQHLKKKLHDKHLSTAVGDEGGFAPALKDNREAVEYICAAIKAAGYTLGKHVSLAMDVAASSFYDEHKKQYSLGNRDQLMGFYGELLREYPIVSIEDGLEENDWTGWRELTQKFGAKTQLVGDDLFVTQAQYVRRGIEEKVANAVLIKVNQVGTLSETFETMALCRKAGYGAVTSHRSGETEDVTIAHLAVGSGCGQIKTGSLSRSERTAKYNELLRIEEWARANSKSLPYVDVFRA